MATVCYRVPYTAVEWNRVRTLFRSDDLEELEECLAILSMWYSRMSNKIPVALSMSDLLIRLAIAELRITNDSNQWMKMEELKMQYCIAIIRFINYVNEICQCPRGTSIAKAVQQEHFWTRQPYEALRSAGAVNTSKEIVAAEASIRDQKIFNAIASYALLRNKDASDSISNKSALTELMRYVMQQPFDFIRVFVGDGCLIMTESQLNFAGYSVEQGWSVPVALQFYWKPVFVIIYEGKVVNELIINLLSRLSLNENPPHVELQLVAWTKFFLEPCIEDTNDLITLSDWSRILHKLVASTGYFDVTLVESVMAKLPNISEKRRRQVRRIMRISLSESLSAIDDSMSVRTLADLQRLIRKDRGTVSTTGDVSTQSHFVLCEPEEWCSVPLGLLPFKSVDNFSLIMDDDYMDCQRNGQQLDDLHTIVEDE